MGDARKAWCCEHRSVGCAKSLSTGGQTNEHAPSFVKHTEDQKTPEEDESEEFDCGDGLSNWEREWTDTKKTWCCDRHQVACLRTEGSSGFGFGTIVTLLVLSGGGLGAWYWYRQQAEGAKFSKIGGGYRHEYRPPAWDNL